VVGKMEIRDVNTIVTAPEGINLVVVKVETNEPDLYGLGCATFTQRPLPVRSAVQNYLKPLLEGRDPRRIEEIWQMAKVSSYWRNGPVLNNALSGVDMALWDIKGKLSGEPLYQLLGGKCREAAPAYRHADGADPGQVEESARRLMEQGYRYVRCQLGGYGGNFRGKETKEDFGPPEGALSGAYYDPSVYARSVPDLFEHLRDKLGFEVELLHDVHERLDPIEALRLAKELEPYRLFFLEDPLAPEEVGWFQRFRQATTTPLAMGELFNNPVEWKELISKRLIDFIRVHISQIGGITPAQKLAHLCENFGVRTAWHGPGDVSPVGHAANLHLDLASPNFGVQEWPGMSDELRAVFPGAPQVKEGYIYPNEEPGLGIDIDEEEAKKFPPQEELPQWTEARKPDGSPARP